MKNVEAPVKEENAKVSSKNQKEIENHKKAAVHFDAAAKHHLEAAKHYEAGDHDKALKSAVKADDHHNQAMEVQKKSEDEDQDVEK